MFEIYTRCSTHSQVDDESTTQRSYRGSLLLLHARGFRVFTGRGIHSSSGFYACTWGERTLTWNKERLGSKHSTSDYLG